MRPWEERRRSLREFVSSPTKGLEEVLYPDATLHEIIASAVLHRDYSMPSDIYIRIYDSHVEVPSPG